LVLEQLRLQLMNLHLTIGDEHAAAQRQGDGEG